MPAVVTPQDVADLVQSILPDLDRMNWEQIAQNLQDYEMMSHWLKDDKITFNDGLYIKKIHLLSNSQRKVMMSGLETPEAPSTADNMPS